MTEAFTDAVASLNMIAASMGDMDEDEARTVSMLVIDLAAYLMADNPPPVWEVRPMRMTMQ